MEETFAKSINELLPEKEETDEFFIKLAEIIAQIVIGAFVIVIGAFVIGMLLIIISIILALLQLSIENFQLIILTGCLAILILTLLWIVGATTTSIIDLIIGKKNKTKDQEE